jgi:hypothetical protein
MTGAPREPGKAAASTGSDDITHDGITRETRDGSSVNNPSSPDAVRQEALRRHRQGWTVIPLRPGTKVPVQANWTTHRCKNEQEIETAFWLAEPDRNVAAPGVGVVLGKASGGLVVVDLDAADPMIASLVLPSTSLRDGRLGRPDAHWFYRVTDKGPFTKASFTGAMADKPLIELLGDGQQVVIPPSRHESGEYRTWVVDGEPAEIDADTLRAAAGKAAAFAEIALVWQRLGHIKHDSALPLIGGLLRANIEPETVETLLDHIWDSAERHEVRNAVASTVARRDDGEPYSGWKRLRELWGDEFSPSIEVILSWLGVEGADDERPRVLLQPGHLDKATDAAWIALRQRNDPPFLFSQATAPVRVETDHKGRAVIAPVDAYRMRYHLSQQIRWETIGKEGPRPTDVPLEVVRNVLAAPNVPLPPLTRVTVAPVLSPTGELELDPGYHATSRSFYAPLPGFQVPAVPEAPAHTDVERAKALLLDELLGDFPFDGAAEKANALALALLPFGRAVIDGPTPIHFIEAPKPGTGKSKLADLVTRLFCGPAGAPSVAETSDDEEWRKRITSMLATGSPFIFVDNVTALLDSSSLSTATTKTEWSDRRLGTNEQVTFDIAVVWIVTANNASVSADIARRSVRIRLNAKVEDPFQRDPSQFRHPHLEAWVAEHWGELVWACLTLWRAWVAAGMTRGGAVLGSFEAWAGVMSGLLETIGVRVTADHRAHGEPEAALPARQSERGAAHAGGLDQ